MPRSCIAIINNSYETFLGNAGLVQCFAMGTSSRSTISRNVWTNLIAPFELRTAFSRQRFSQLLMFEGEPPAAAIRLEHQDVAAIRNHIAKRTGGKL